MKMAFPMGWMVALCLIAFAVAVIAARAGLKISKISADGSSRDIFTWNPGRFD